MDRKLITRLVCTGIGALALTTAAFGQDRKAEPMPTPEVVGKVPIGISVEEQDVIASGYRASKLVKASIYNDKGQRIGKVDDVIVAPDGKLSIAVVDVGGFLGIGARQVAIPIRQLSQISPKAVLPGATKETLKEMPPFEWSKER